jgi:hypothetical protein
MTSIAPRETWRDALDVQHEMVRWLESKYGQYWLDTKERLEGEGLMPRTRDLQHVMFQSVPLQVRGGVPIFVSSDMCRLVEAAAPSFQPEPIWPTDVLNLSGFLYYERPFQVDDRFNRPTNIKALSWTPVMADSAINPERLLSRDDEVMEWLEERHRKGLVDGISLTLYSEPDKNEWQTELGSRQLTATVPMPPLEPMHVTPWWWGMEFEGNEFDENGVPTGAAWWWKIVQVTFRLMQQRIGTRYKQRPYRPQRREAKRMRMPDNDVLVVTLRREHSTHKPGEPMREMHYDHRFIVEGHWRNQYYPSTKNHRQIYIADYEKGPEGAPLIIKPRAYKWTR